MRVRPAPATLPRPALLDRQPRPSGRTLLWVTPSPSCRRSRLRAPRQAWAPARGSIHPHPCSTEEVPPCDADDIPTRCPRPRSRQASRDQSRHAGGPLTPTSPTDKQGSAAVRLVLEEAAERAKTRPPFTGFYAQCAARRGRHIATVAVARKLLARCFHVLTEVDNRQHNHADHTSEKVTSPGALEVPHAPAIRPL